MQPRNPPALAPEDFPSVEHLVTEDETPVDNMFAEHQHRMLVDVLRASWNPGRPFLAVSNVGLFHEISQPPLVPDFMLSMDVEPAAAPDLQRKENRSYFLWRIGKPPEIVGEVVSNREGGELGHKLDLYARIGVEHYFVYDPYKYLSEKVLQVFRKNGVAYEPSGVDKLGDFDLGLKIWRGVYEDMTDDWLRWSDSQGVLLSTGVERALLAEALAERESQRADEEQQRAERLAEKLRQAGIDPES